MLYNSLKLVYNSKLPGRKYSYYSGKNKGNKVKRMNELETNSFVENKIIL